MNAERYEKIWRKGFNSNQINFVGLNIIIGLQEQGNRPSWQHRTFWNNSLSFFILSDPGWRGPSTASVWQIRKDEIKTQNKRKVTLRESIVSTISEAWGKTAAMKDKLSSAQGSLCVLYLYSHRLITHCINSHSVEFKNWLKLSLNTKIKCY